MTSGSTRGFSFVRWLALRATTAVTIIARELDPRAGEVYTCAVLLVRVVLVVVQLTVVGGGGGEGKLSVAEGWRTERCYGMVGSMTGPAAVLVCGLARPGCESLPLGAFYVTRFSRDHFDCGE